MRITLERNGRVVATVTDADPAPTLETRDKQVKRVWKDLMANGFDQLSGGADRSGTLYTTRAHVPFTMKTLGDALALLQTRANVSIGSIRGALRT